MIIPTCKPEKRIKKMIILTTTTLIRKYTKDHVYMVKGNTYIYIDYRSSTLYVQKLKKLFPFSKRVHQHC